MTGVTSVTFRRLLPKEIIDLTVKAGLDGIEWGSDIHVPAGDTGMAASVRKQTEGAGLRVLSYGSYYRLMEHSAPEAAFMPYLMSAEALNAPNIRIWPGGISPGKAVEGDYEAAAEELKVICRMADEYGVTVSMEYHRSSLTETPESARKLLEMVNYGNFYTYWQPDPDLSCEENRRAAGMVRDYVSNVHVFYWENNEKERLAKGAADWKVYLDTLRLDKSDASFIMEFVVDDSRQIFLEDAEVLKSFFN